MILEMEEEAVAEVVSNAVSLIHNTIIVVTAFRTRIYWSRVN